MWDERRLGSASREDRLKETGQDEDKTRSCRRRQEATPRDLSHASTGNRRRFTCPLMSPICRKDGSLALIYLVDGSLAYQNAYARCPGTGTFHPFGATVRGGMHLELSTHVMKR